MNWPQITWIVSACLSLGAYAVTHGRVTKVNFFARFAEMGLLCFLLWSGGFFAHAGAIPADAARYQRELTRNARVVWGLEAPVSTFAAQIHQESRWKNEARSPVGAQGLAQFMPGTSSWIAGAYREALGANQPYNPDWALRALVTYNKWHYDRISAASDCDRWAFVLSAYNGGLGWVQRDRKKAGQLDLDSSRYWGEVEYVNAGRSAANFKENRGYPDRIINRWQPVYQRAGWGLGVCNENE